MAVAGVSAVCLTNPNEVKWAAGPGPEPAPALWVSPHPAQHQLSS